jgi:N-methylhydantoinase A
VALIDGDIRLTSEGHIGPWPVAVPMVDMHTIGAGGGSIAAIDAGGLLQVGPESAGASPGPACSGRGGGVPTVTDANLVLGRLRPDAFLGGAMSLDTGAAERAVASIAQPLGLDLASAAQGIIDIANEHMIQALRVISVQRGVDPRDHVLVSFGGAGGLHVCALAEALGMTQALVPVHAGVLSALGMLVAPHARQLSHTLAGVLAGFEEVYLEGQLQALAEKGRLALAAEGIAPTEIETGFSLDLRYQGQSYTLTLPWRGLEATRQAFHAAHERRYGHRLQNAVELVNIRCNLHGRPPAITLPQVEAASGGRAAPRYGRLAGHAGQVTVWQRENLPVGQKFSGPALITETVATTYVASAWDYRRDPVGNLLLQRSGEPL